VQGLTNSQVQSGAYALILAEEKGPKRIPIIVGMAEAQSIAIALERITPPRPLTHDLFVTLFKAIGMKLVEVFVYKFDDGVFFSEIVLEKADGERVTLDSRTSDAVALLLRTGGEVYTTRRIMQECGVLMEEDQMDDDTDDIWPEVVTEEIRQERKLGRMNMEELQKCLDISVQKEDYEEAKMYRDELRRRQNI